MDISKNNTNLVKTLIFVALSTIFTILCGVLVDIPLWVNVVIGCITSLCLQLATIPTLKFFGKIFEAILD